MERSRIINLHIKGQNISIKVKDPTTEWDLRLQAAVKHASIGAEGGLPALLHESWLMDISDNTATTVPSELLAPMLAARVCVAEILATTDMDCFADLQKVVI
jgi:hypothetical protein